VIFPNRKRRNSKTAEKIANRGKCSYGSKSSIRAPSPKDKIKIPSGFSSLVTPEA